MFLEVYDEEGLLCGEIRLDGYDLENPRDCAHIIEQIKTLLKDE